MDKEARKEHIRQLVEQQFQWDSNRDQSEADIRAKYIDWLFDHLGWDMWGKDPRHKTRCQRESYVRGAGYVDMALELGGEPALFVEAKRLGKIPAAAERQGDRTPEERQVFKYARAKHIPYAILTNFQRLHVFNADQERLILAFDDPKDYVERFDDLWRLSPEEVERGSLPWWESQLGKKDVDLEFLKALRRWRLLLANAIYQHNLANPVLKKDGGFHFPGLMAVVQRILDRLILIRYGDDKEVLLTHDLLESMLADYENRGAYAGPDHLAKAFADLSHMMDQKHNTSLFQKGHICEQVVVPNEPLAEVIRDMATISFRKFTSDILGNTYESYLGTKLVLRNGEITDEERKDVRKGHGIYYTPTWVVKYILDNTLGKTLQELQAQYGLMAIQKARGLTVLDPACGSGSFLIYAYQVFADFYRRLNEAIEQEKARLVTQATQLKMFDTLEQLKQLPEPVYDYPQVILKEHLFGVDLDPEAAEIAAVNLTMQAFADSRQTKLPLILNENIRVGNSLIGAGGPELRPFDWGEVFPAITSKGGFDVVIGNPPYVRIQGLQKEADYYRGHYESAYGSFDLYVLFIERGLSLVKPGGKLGYITSGKFLKAQYGKKLQELLMREATVEAIVDLSAQTVFAEATTYPAIIILRKGASKSGLKYVPVSADVQPETGPGLDALPTVDVPQTAIKGGVWPPPVGDAKVLMEKLVRASDTLGTLSEHVFTGLQTSADDVYILEKRRDGASGTVFAYSRALDREVELESAPLKPLLSGKHIDRYVALETRQLLLFPYEVHAGQAALIDAGRFSRDYPLCWAYLQANRQRLEDREGGKMRHERWYAFGRTQSLGLHDYRKLAIPRLVHRLQVFYDKEGCFYLDNVDVGGLILKQATDSSYKYVLGLLNSKLLDWYFRQMSVPFRGDFRSANKQYLEPLPIRRIDFSNKDDKAQYDWLVKLVEEMLALQARLAPGSDRGLAPLRFVPSSERAEVEHAIALKDREIDEAVYDLYGLTNAERALVTDAGEQSPRPKPGPRRLA